MKKKVPWTDIKTTDGKPPYIEFAEWSEYLFDFIKEKKT